MLKQLQRFRYKYFRILIPVFVLVCTSGCSNDSGQSSESTLKIISLSPHASEIVYALEADENLIAVSDFCKYPPAVQSKPKIGGLLDPNIEKIAALQPDILFGVPAHQQLNRDLQPFGLHITMLANETLQDVLLSITTIGQVLKKSAQAHRLLNSIEMQLDSVRARATARKRISGMLVIGREKGSLRNLMVAGPGTFLDEIWELAGGENIYHDLTQRYTGISLESVLDRQPQVIVTFKADDPPVIREISAEPEWRILRAVPAVRNRKVFEISGSHTLIPGPRVTRLAKDFEAVLLKAAP